MIQWLHYTSCMAAVKFWLVFWFFFFLSFILVKSVCGCRAQLFIVKALAILIKMEYYFKLFTIEVEENEGGRIRGKLDMF